MLLADPQQAVSEAQTMLGQLREAEAIDTVRTAVIVNLVETILVYKSPTLSREEIQQMLDLTDTDLKQTRFYQDVSQEVEQNLILRQLQRRCGEL